MTPRFNAAPILSMGEESQRSEVIRHGCLRTDGVNPLIRPSQFDLCSRLRGDRRQGRRRRGYAQPPFCLHVKIIKIRRTKPREI